MENNKKHVTILVEDSGKLNVFVNTENVDITFMKFNGDFGDFVTLKRGDVYLSELKNWEEKN